MIKIEKKNVKNKGFYYLSEQVNIGEKFKKNQVYLGKNIPNDFKKQIESLKNKEFSVIEKNIKNIFEIERGLDLCFYKEIEKTRLNFKYYFWNLSESKQKIFWRDFAVRFIFESNSIEGSRLSKEEVEKIIRGRYIKKTLDRREIIETHNSIKAFDYITKNKIKLSQENIKGLHKILVKDLGVKTGYKKEEIIVNNKKTCPPNQVRKEMTDLINWWEDNVKTKKNKFLLAIKFHQKFEKIHPFTDGNGRVGRLILIWMITNFGYGVILFKNKNRQKYYEALNQADEGRNKKLYLFAIETYKKTFNNIIKEIS
jgi:Fic family protein